MLAGLVTLGFALLISFTGSDEDTTASSIFGRNIYGIDKEIGSLADPEYEVTFPKDHASHDFFDIEWWYLTANLEASNGKIYGLQWTLFRFRNPAADVSSTNMQNNTWHNNQMFMAHASVHSMKEHWFSEKFARGGVGNAAVISDPFILKIDDWQWKNFDKGYDLLPAILDFKADSDDITSSKLEVSLHLSNQGPYILHGNQGYSVKSTSGHASHYYSAPFIDVKGTLKILSPTERIEKIEVTGQAWFDHEWTSGLFDQSTLGWDWLSLHLDDGSKLMAFRMRVKGQNDYISASYISPEGKQKSLLPSQISLKALSETQVDNKRLPLQWAISIPSQDIEIKVSAMKDDQWNKALVPYYEGMMKVEGSHKGNGFLELTGY